jgi:hypothetical protein
VFCRSFGHFSTSNGYYLEIEKRWEKIVTDKVVENLILHLSVGSIFRPENLPKSYRPKTVTF